MADIELQEMWDKLNSTFNKQKLINEKIIRDIIKIKFSNKLKTIIKYESIGTIILLIAITVLIKNIEKFDTLPLQISAAVSIFIMILLPILSLSSIFRMKNMNMSLRNCRENVVEYSKRQSQFLLVQKWGVAISPILLLAIIPPFVKLSKGEDFFSGDSNNIIWYTPIALIAIMYFARWGFRCYVRITNNAKKLLQELEGDSHE